MKHSLPFPFRRYVAPECILQLVHRHDSQLNLGIVPQKLIPKISKLFPKEMQSLAWEIYIREDKPLSAEQAEEGQGCQMGVQEVKKMKARV